MTHDAHDSGWLTKRLLKISDDDDGGVKDGENVCIHMIILRACSKASQLSSVQYKTVRSGSKLSDVMPRTCVIQ